MGVVSLEPLAPIAGGIVRPVTGWPSEADGAVAAPSAGAALGAGALVISGDIPGCIGVAPGSGAGESPEGGSAVAESLLEQAAAPIESAAAMPPKR